ncbi:testis-expressed protein 26 [Genypterus blacodes]|uniref:testis-expressed protein 26 n=1 Tax=Genypterus blacodes TaxID=154954 RepID=UPI003F765D5E
MATKERKLCWDPYETTQRREFIYRPNSAGEILLYPASTSFTGTHSHSCPFGPTVYKKEFSWKPTSKPECIRTGTATRQRRNNPHPSQSFMMCRLPRGAIQIPDYVGFPGNCLPSEEDMCAALTAQYRSIYRRDFMGLPQGCVCINNADGRIAPPDSRRMATVSVETEMRDNYCQPKQKPDLQDSHLYHSCNARRHVACHGIVPTVVQRHIHTQQKRSDLTTYDRFCGKRVTSTTPVIKNLRPHELQQLYKVLPEEGEEHLYSVLSRNAHPTNREKVNKLPRVVFTPSSPERISVWPGPV